MDVLFVSPHPDDFLLCAGATLAKHKEAGDRIFLIFISECEHLERNAGIREETTSVIGTIQPHKVTRLDIKNKLLWYPTNREMLRACLEHYRDDLMGVQSLVYCPWERDVHQDHVAAFEEVRRVFRYSSVLQWYHPHSCPGFDADYYVSVTPEQADWKVMTMKMFVTQKNLTYCKEYYLRNVLEFGGHEINDTRAERFKVWRWIDG